MNDLYNAESFGLRWITEYQLFDPKTLVGQFAPHPPPPPSPCGISNNVSSKERLTLWVFVTFNIIISYIFPENFIEIPKSLRRYDDFLHQF